jgi:DMSO reductase family type II enzyme chaperone
MSELAEPLDEGLTVAEESPAAARSRVYGLFAQALQFPQGDTAAALENGQMYQALALAAGALPYRYTFIGPPLIERRELGLCHTALFDAVGGRPQVSMLELRHEGAPPEQQLWEDLLRFYRFFGLDFTGGGARERPDHLLMQIEFMHYLTFLEAGAPDSAQDLRLGQSDFLERHLARWLPSLRVALAQIGEEAAPYDVLVDALARFVGADCTYLGIPLAGPQPPV